MNIERMRKAVALWMSIPSSQWNMNLYYFSLTNCGCAIGNLAAAQHEGWYMNGLFPACIDIPSDIASPDTAFRTAEEYFGMDRGDSKIFRHVGRFPEESASLPIHKQIFFMRLDRLLLEKGIPLELIYGPGEREVTDPADDESFGEHPCYVANKLA